MKRILVAAVATATLGSLAAPGVAAAQTSPTLTLKEACLTSEGTRSYGVTVEVAGVAPNSPVSGFISSTAGGGVGGTIPADESGTLSVTVYLGPGVYTVEVTSPFSARQSLTVDCLPNDTSECKDGGWQGFFGVFKNEGDCVSFVATGGKNPPVQP